MHGGHERDFVGRAAAGLAALHLAAEVGVVNLYPAGELALLLSIDHHLHDLVLKQPGAGVGHAQVAFALQRRHVVLGLCHQVHGEEPGGQRQLAGLGDDATDQAALVAAGAALEIQPVMPVELAVPDALAARAHEAPRPAPGTHDGLTLLGRTLSIGEFRYAQALAGTAPCSAP